MISENLKRELLIARARGTKQYEIARRAGLHPSVLSAIVHAAIPVRRGDRRVLRLAEVLGVSEADCFEEAARG